MGTLSTSEDSETEGISESLTVLIARELEDEINKNNKKKNASKQKNFTSKKSQVLNRKSKAPSDNSQVPSRNSQDPASNVQVPSPGGSPKRSPMKDKKVQDKNNPALGAHEDRVALESKAGKKTVGSPAKVQFRKYNMPTRLPRKQDDPVNMEHHGELIDVEDISLERREDRLGKRRFLRAIDKVIEANRSSQHEVARSSGSSSPRQR